jgi:hypothetical protein
MGPVTIDSSRGPNGSAHTDTYKEQRWTELTY